jgi:hypothetical protein
MIHTENMEQVSDSELLPDGWYQVRISAVKETDDSGQQLVSKSGGNPIVKLTLKVTSEGPFLGRQFSDSPSLQSHALFKLKAYYKSVGYFPGSAGHDPEKLLDGECWVMVTSGMYDGHPTLNIPPYGIKSLQEGPGRQGKQTPARVA